MGLISLNEKIRKEIRVNYLEEFKIKLCSLVVFRDLLNDDVMRALLEVLSQNSKKSVADSVRDYSEFVSQLYKYNENLSQYVWDKVLSEENVYVLKSAQEEHIDEVLEEALDNDLKILNEVSNLTAKKVKMELKFEGFLPEWRNKEIDFVGEYRRYIGKISTVGYGIYLKHYMFLIKNGKVVPAKNPDRIKFADLKGYERERKEVVDNTVALLEGKPAANVLLYGDAGTGKSSTVKAIVNEFGNQGLRLVEIRKNQILEIPDITDELSKNPLKFILFIDDLSFSQDNEEIGALKAILEGTVSARASNIVIYVTSNRRHLVKELFSDRGHDDVHINETIQEQVSLSERFGLMVYFSKPNKDGFLKIVHELADEYKIIDQNDLDLRAEGYASDKGGRSPRVARQFVEYLKSME